MVWKDPGLNMFSIPLTIYIIHIIIYHVYIYYIYDISNKYHIYRLRTHNMQIQLHFVCVGCCLLISVDSLFGGRWSIRPRMFTYLFGSAIAFEL